MRFFAAALPLTSCFARVAARADLRFRVLEPAARRFAPLARARFFLDDDERVARELPIADDSIARTAGVCCDQPC